MSKEIKKDRLNVFQRIHAVMEDVGTVAKNGKNSFQNYEYATEADFVHAIRPLLVKHGLVIIPQNAILNGVGDLAKDNKLTSISIQYNVVAIDDPTDYTAVTMMGQGSDKGDKGIYKAITGTKKYMIANLFMIATGDDPEKDGPKKKLTSSPTKSNIKSEDF